MKGKTCLFLITLSLILALASLSPALAETAPVPTEGPFRLEEETFGPLYIGMPEAELREIPCAWEALGEPEFWGADGLEHWEVSCAGLGITLGLARNPGDGSGAFVYSFTATAPCEWKTPRGLGIGDTAAMIKSLYQDAIDTQWAPDTDEAVLIGTLYGGILAMLEEGRVVSLFFGAMAE